MNQHLNVVVDVSGSMTEMGKILLQQTLCRFIRQWTAANAPAVTLKFYLWEQQVTPLPLDPLQDIPPFTAAGQADWQALATFCTALQQDDVLQRVLLLTDGSASGKTLRAFQAAFPPQTALYLCPVATGADADSQRLEEIADNARVFAAEDIATAIAHVLRNKHERFLMPVSLNEIRTGTVSKQSAEGAEDDWND